MNDVVVKRELKKAPSSLRVLRPFELIDKQPGCVSMQSSKGLRYVVVNHVVVKRELKKAPSSLRILRSFELIDKPPGCASMQT